MHIYRYEQCSTNLGYPCNKLYLTVVFEVVSDVEGTLDHEANIRKTYRIFLWMPTCGVNLGRTCEHDLTEHKVGAKSPVDQRDRQRTKLKVRLSGV